MAYRKPKGKRKARKVIREYKEGKLKSSSGEKVTSHDQAVAIAMSEQRKAKGMSSHKPPMTRHMAEDMAMDEYNYMMKGKRRKK